MIKYIYIYIFFKNFFNYFIILESFFYLFFDNENELYCIIIFSLVLNVFILLVSCLYEDLEINVSFIFFIVCCGGFVIFIWFRVDGFYIL